MNKVILAGNVGGDPEARVTGSGNTVVNFSIATSYKRDGNERTDWHRIVAWGRTAEVIRDHVKKGDKVLIEGRIQYDSYERDGVTIPTSEITVTHFHFI